MTTSRTLDLTDPSRRAADDDRPRPIRTYVWEPDAEPVGTVVVSHGTGGAAETMAWLAEPLADAGFRAVSVDHHGNSYPGGYRAEGFCCWWDRPRDFTVVLDALGVAGPVGAAGFSLGGYTAAALLGARIDAGAYADLMYERVPAPPVPEYPDLVAELRARVTVAERAGWVDAAGGDYRDPRVSAGFLVCPGIGPMVTAESLARITAPVSVWWAGADDQAPADTNALRYAGLIPGATGHAAGDEVGHYWFLGATDAGAGVRSVVAADAVAFFRRALGPAGS